MESSTVMDENGVILRTLCKEPEGNVVRSVSPAVLSIPTLRYYWEKLSQFRVLFNRHIEDFDDFIESFLTQDRYGNIQGTGLVWNVDDVGLIYVTDIYPGFQATGHFVFWDRRQRGREGLCLHFIQYLMRDLELHRLVCEIPLYIQPTLRFVERLGFVREGTLRQAAMYEGKWFDVAMFSILDSEIAGLLERRTNNGVPEAEGADTSSEVAGNPAG